ncbi:hypothetical protein [Cohnella terricola]|uniref:YtkA-like domain-containing protein n=1 Tax=Cohnella terricola TaxID=1289167 RepID=A0A559JQ58_9BACL|nr:hypothetical protein [Cohnella terricola]TVY01988.1 hypothetical protein FPZ45_05965 [Cohnella terricola]
MRKTFMGLFLVLVLTALIVTGCSSSPQAGDQDPKNIKVELTTEPAPARVGEETKLVATITGLLDEKNTTVQFEIRQSDNKGLPELIEEVDYSGSGHYSANFVFKESVKYDVYIHIYNGELHVTKKKPVEVAS